MAAPECLGYHGGRVGGGDIIHGNVPYAPVGQHPGQYVGHILRVAVNGTIGNHDSLFLRLSSPGQVLVHIPPNVRSPHRSVKGARVWISRAEAFFKKGLYGRTVLTDDIGIISSGIIQPVTFKVYSSSANRFPFIAPNVRRHLLENKVLSVVS